jgi:error-prone DNA polymerase
MQYAELHCKTNFSFLEGASHASELVERAVELGYHALAVTDRNTLAGVVRAHTAANDAGLKLLIGAEITPIDAAPVVLWATDRKAYGRLSRLITVGRRRVEKGECQLTFDDIAKYADGLIAGVVGARGERRGTREGSGEQGAEGRGQSEIDAMQRIAGGRHAPRLRGHAGTIPETLPFPESATRCVAATPSPLPSYRDLFGDRCCLLAELHRGPDDRRRLAELIALSKETNIPLAAAGDVHYHIPGRLPLHDVLAATRHGMTVAEAGDLLFTNAQRHLKALDEIAVAFADVPDAIRRTVEIADRCSFSLDELRYEYPEELAPPGLTPMQHLRKLTHEGARWRYPRGVPAKITQLVEHELALIEDLHYEAYFLTVWDLVRFARGRGILCQGRGSAANSVVCYCLGVTAVDPQRTDVLFERFVSRERNEAPDIDVDFEHERREEVLQYLYEKYGRERAGLTAEAICYRTRSAVRDVGKALGFSLDRVDALAKQVEGHHREMKLAERCRQVGIDPESETGSRLIHLVRELTGFPRHLSQHVGGMVMTQGPLCELCPIENAAMDDRTVIQWDKDDLDELGILKVDCLALGMLTAIRKAFAMIRRHRGRELSLASIPEGDQAVYDDLCRADTMGVFQIESRAQMSMLPRLRPRCYYDLVIEVAIVRPGPIQGNMVHPYLRRRKGNEAVSYPNDEIRQVLEKTLGVPIFQEQAMRLAVVAAGFTPGEADQLRRAMGAWRRPGVIDEFRLKLLAGMREQGLSEEFAEQVFNQIRGFGEYGFPESHAASFALLVYVSAWLKHYYHEAFTASLINSQPMGFYAPAQLLRDARDHGVTILPIDVNRSDWDCTLEGARDERQGARDERQGARGKSGGRRLEVGDQGTESGGEITASQRQRGFREQGSEIGDQESETRDQSELMNGEKTDLPSSLSPRPSPPSSPQPLRLGFRLINGFSERHAETIRSAREAGPFTSVEDFTRRTGFSRAVLTRLAEADALSSLGRDRRAALWETLAQEKQTKATPLFDAIAPQDEPPVSLPPLTAQEQVFADYQTTGLSLKAHPISFYRPQLDELQVTPVGDLPHIGNNRFVKVAGLVLLRQRPSTAKGITFATIEDETGAANLLIHRKTWEQFHDVARGSAAYLAHGKLESKESVIHIVVRRLEDLSSRLKELKSKSRDFR